MTTRRWRVPFNRSTRVEAEAAYVASALATGHLAGNGPYAVRCEDLLRELVGARRAFLTPSGTAALEMAALVLGLEPGDEVIVPSYTFVSTAQAWYAHGARPVFADCRPDTLNLDERGLEALVTPRTRVIVAMHYGGVACEMESVLDVAAKHGLAVVEDNAHGLFGTYRGRALGSLGVVAAQSFHETKNVTCGEGGALLVNDATLVGRAEIARENGTDRAEFLRGRVDRYTWVGPGGNFLASELQAAVLCAQLEARGAVQARRHAIWQRYDAALRPWAEGHGVACPAVPDHCDHPAHHYFLLLPSPDARRRLIAHLQGRGIQAVFHYVPLHSSAMGRRLGAAPGDCPVAEDVAARIVRLPFFTALAAADQDEVIESVRDSVA